MWVIAVTIIIGGWVHDSGYASATYETEEACVQGIYDLTILDLEENSAGWLVGHFEEREAVFKYKCFKGL